MPNVQVTRGGNGGLLSAEGVDYHSFSSINTFTTVCSLQYRFRYLDRLPPERVAAALVFGIAINEALRAIDEDLLKGRSPDLEGAHGVLRSHLEKAFAKRDLPVVSPHDEGLEELTEKGKGMVEHYASTLSPDEAPLDLARRFTIPLIDDTGDALPRPLVGELDRWVRLEDGRTGVDDWKTAASRWSEDRLSKDDQATTYLLAGEYILGRRPDFFRYALLLKTRKPVVERHVVERTPRDTRRFLAKVRIVDKALKSGVFVPNDTSFACPTCPYRDACRNWRD